ncbi:MAG: dTMP kinase [Coriobacteriia bacterium]|nr:dTMP kinase [Coriobacteriia bacterium]
MSANATTSPGVLISFEGGEGVGKSTHIRLLAARIEASGRQVLMLREPGGSRIGEKIRAFLLDLENTDIDALAELLLYEAARAQLVAEQIAPALASGRVVLLDRFIDSTLAYQGYGRGLPLPLVRQANAIGSRGLTPDRTIVFVSDVQGSLAKAQAAGADRLESEGLDFHERVTQGFIELAKAEPERICLIAPDEDKRTTAAEVAAAVVGLLPGLPLDFQLSDQLIKSAKRAQTR